MSSSPSNQTTDAAAIYDCRDAFSQTLQDLAAEDPAVCVVLNDSISSTKLKNFQGKYPERLVNVGIAEQNMLGVGAGLANGGMLPYVCGAACFLTARAMEQVKVDLGYSKSNVKLCGMSSGMAYGELGPTHHSIEDIAWLRIIPNLTVVVPADSIETASAMRYSRTHVGPMFLRISRVPVRNVHAQDHTFRLGKANVLHPGDDVALLASGVMVERALDAARQLAKSGVGARVLNMSSIKPMDEEAVLEAARTTRVVITVEEGLAAGGLGGAVAELLALKHPGPMRIMGVPDTFAPTGSANFLLEHFGLTSEGIQRTALHALESL